MVNGANLFRPPFGGLTVMLPRSVATGRDGRCQDAKRRYPGCIVSIAKKIESLSDSWEWRCPA
jgi:hypothetical protein